MASYQREYVVGVVAIPGVDDNVEANATESRVGTKAVNADMKDVDMFRSEDAGQLMELSQHEMARHICRH